MAAGDHIRPMVLGTQLANHARVLKATERLTKRGEQRSIVLGAVLGVIGLASLLIVLYLIWRLNKQPPSGEEEGKSPVQVTLPHNTNPMMHARSGSEVAMLASRGRSDSQATLLPDSFKPRSDITPSFIGRTGPIHIVSASAAEFTTPSSARNRRVAGGPRTSDVAHMTSLLNRPLPPAPRHSTETFRSIPAPLEPPTVPLPPTPQVPVYRQSPGLRRTLLRKQRPRTIKVPPPTRLVHLILDDSPSPMIEHHIVAPVARVN